MSPCEIVSEGRYQKGDHVGDHVPAIGQHRQPVRQNQSSHSADQRNNPADKQSIPDSVREIDSTNGRHNQITENQKDPSDSHETCYHETENSIKKKIPPAHAQPFLVGAVAIVRNEQEVFAANKMEDHERNQQSEPLQN